MSDYDGHDRRTPNGAYREIAREAVRETFKAVGADVDNPLELQKDFAHLRGHRCAREQAGKTVRRTLITVAVSSALGGAWLLLKDQLPGR